MRNSMLHTNDMVGDNIITYYNVEARNVKKENSTSKLCTKINHVKVTCVPA